MERYRRAQDLFDSTVEAVPASSWDRPSACEQWTVRDVAGHVVWGQEQLRHWATGEPYAQPDGPPGSAHPGVLAAGEPVESWRQARKATLDVLTDDALARTVTLPGLGEQPLSSIVTLLITDLLAHAWDIGHAVGIEVRPDDDLVRFSHGWARANVFRVPGFFGPGLTAHAPRALPARPSDRHPHHRPGRPPPRHPRHLQR